MPQSGSEPSTEATQASSVVPGSEHSDWDTPGADETQIDEASTLGRSRPRPPQKLQRGDTVARYVVLEEVGRGAMGRVYLAIDPDLERRVALKVLHRRQARLLGEARALARLAHPNVVGIYDVGESEGRPFIAMEYVDGVAVDAWLEREPRDWTEVVDVFIAAGRGLSAAHAAGLIHRDFKPANVMVAHDGGIKVTDFGLARAAETGAIESSEDGENESSIDESLPPELGSRSGRSELTMTRGGVGTPAYMAPELHHGEPASAKADQFSFCVALYQSVYGEHPFGGGDVVSVIAAVVSGETKEAPAGSPVPARLRRILLEGLRADPAERHPSMDGVVDALVALRTPARRTAWIVTAVTTVGLGTWWALQPAPPDPCAEVDAPIEEAWTADRASELTAAFGRSGLPFAARASEEAVGRLDAYATQWRTMQQQACRDQRSADVAVVRNAALAEPCLERARNDMLAVTDVLVQGSPAAVTHATALVYGLPELPRCVDPNLASSMPIPEDADTRAEVARVRAELSQIRAQRIARQTGGEAGQALDALAQQAEALGFAPLRAEVAMARAFGKLDESHEAGAAMFEQALQLAVAGDADLVAANATAELLGLDGDVRGEDRRAQAWEQLARGYLQRWPEHGRLSMKLLATLSRTLSNRGDYDEAVTLALEAANRAEALEDPWQASVHRGNYGMILARAGRLEEAIATLQAHVEHTVALYGPEHPEAAWAYNALGHAYRQRENLDAAKTWLTKAVATYRPLDDLALERAQALNNLSTVLSAQGELDGSRALMLEAVESLRQHTEGDHATLALLLNNLGDNASQRGQHEEAVRYFRDALAMRTRLGDAPLTRLLPTANLAAEFHAMGDHEAARRQLRETLVLMQRHVPDEYPMAGPVYHLVGDTYLQMGDVAEAVEHLTTAERLLRAKAGPDSEGARRAAARLAEARAQLP